MFNPGQLNETISIAWKRLSCRTVFLAMREYFTKIFECRLQLESARVRAIPLDAFPSAEISANRVDEHFAIYFSREMYKFGNGVDDYPDTFAGQSILPSRRPLVFLTRKKTPRHSRCRFLVPIGIDANHLTREGMEEIAARTHERNVENPPSNHQLYLCRFVIESNDDVFLLYTALKKSNQFSFTRLHLQESFNVNSPLTCCFLRGMIQAMADTSWNGRDFNAHMNFADMCDTVGQIHIYGMYNWSHLFYNDGLRYKTWMRNLSKRFSLSFFKTVPDWEDRTYLQEWLRQLKLKTCKDLLVKATDDLDWDGIGELLLYSKRNNTHEAVNTDIDPRQRRTNITLFKQNPNQIRILDGMIMKCRQKSDWRACLSYARINGIVTPLLLESMMKLRIRWCYHERKLLEERYDTNLVSRRIDVMQEMHHDATEDGNTLKQLMELGESEYIRTKLAL
jgi:hypothetical protein